MASPGDAILALCDNDLEHRYILFPAESRGTGRQASRSVSRGLELFGGRWVSNDLRAFFGICRGFVPQ
ncbi:MAG: hypothetical protein CMJ77_02265 [Planctomycetaceae bacterium]|nr:hypothetical protein [Planctomycetaceae bacterium]